MVIVALKLLVVDGQVTSSGEPGWACEGSNAIAENNNRRKKGPKTPKLASKAVRIAKNIRALMQKLLVSSLLKTPTAPDRTQGMATPTCAAAGSGGSIVLVSETVQFASPMRSQRVVAAGGGCLRAPPGTEGSTVSNPPKSKSLHEIFETSGGECAAGGGGRVVIYANQPHPLDPVVSVFPSLSFVLLAYCSCHLETCARTMRKM